MPWIVSDETSARDFHRQTGEAAEVRSGDSLSLALADDRDAVVVVATSENQATLVRIRHNRIEDPVQAVTAVPEPPPPPREIVATGFLGLTDSVDFADEAPPKPRKWWQKLFD